LRPSPLRICLLTLLLIAGAARAEPTAVRLAVVIDDLGYSVEQARQVLRLPRAVTLGLLPFAPHTQDVLALNLGGRELIVHLPMEPEARAGVPIELGTLRLSMGPGQIDRGLRAALAAVPQAVGVNNHTGSLLTQHTEPMAVMMRQLKARGLFFLDSRTTHKTVALATAQAWQVPALERDVFLDHVRTPAALAAEFDRALALARRQGQAVLIGHPHRQSLAFLRQALGTLPADVRLSPLSGLLQDQRQPPGPAVGPAGPMLADRRQSPALPRKSLGQ